MAFGFNLSSITVKIMNRETTGVTKNEGWLAGNNLNRNHLEKFYWLLAILSLINFIIYLFVATTYRYMPQSHSILKQIHY
ncbi:putative proton-dependent oligopeptide transporter family [Helianthus anomalus]